MLSPWLLRARILLARRPALLPAGRAIPALEVRREGVASDPGTLAAYRRLCGFPGDGRLPITWPHVLASALHLALLADRRFPLRALGLVHLRNRISRTAPLGDAERLDLRCTLSGPRETARGQELDLVTEARREGRLVWSETSVLLARRGGRRPAAPAEPEAAPPAGAAVERWELPAGLGRRYAAVSGDWNPIHLAAATARPFGFDRPIAHGMWSLARIAAALGAALPDAGTLEAAFKVPARLPGAVLLRHWPDAGGRAFALRDAADERPHVVGACRVDPGPVDG